MQEYYLAWGSGEAECLECVLSGTHWVLAFPNRAANQGWPRTLCALGPWRAMLSSVNVKAPQHNMHEPTSRIGMRLRTGMTTTKATSYSEGQHTTSSVSARAGSEWQLGSRCRTWIANEAYPHCARTPEQNSGEAVLECLLPDEFLLVHGFHVSVEAVAPSHLHLVLCCDRCSPGAQSRLPEQLDCRHELIDVEFAIAVVAVAVVLLVCVAAVAAGVNGTAQV